MPRADFTAIGSTGLNVSGGEVLEEYQRELKGKRGLETFRLMSQQDPVVKACLRAIEQLCRRVDWPVNPADDSDEADEAARFVEGCLHDLSHSWADTLSEILSFLTYGWAYFELVYKLRQGREGNPTSRYDDGRIGWRKFAIRSQDSLARWVFDDDGGVQGMVQAAPPLYQDVIIPIEKALLFRTSVAKGNPHGESLLIGAYRSWFYKVHLENIEGIGIERDLAGLPVAHVPVEIIAGTDAESVAIRNSLKEVVRNIRRDEQEGLLFPRVYDDQGHLMYELELLSSGGARQFDTDKIITRHDQRIAMSMLAQFLFLGQTGVGSFALSADQTDLFATALGATLDHIAGVLNAHAVPRLLALNGIDPALTPEITHGDIEDVDLGKIGAYITALAGAGVPLFPDNALQQHLFQLAGFPAPVKSDDDLLDEPTPVPTLDEPLEPNDALDEDAE